MPSQVSPNVLNSVPRQARVEIDIRDIEAARRDATVAAVMQVLHAGVGIIVPLLCPQGPALHA